MLACLLPSALLAGSLGEVPGRIVYKVFPAEMLTPAALAAADDVMQLPTVDGRI